MLVGNDKYDLFFVIFVHLRTNFCAFALNGIEIKSLNIEDNEEGLDSVPDIPVSGTQSR